MNTQLRELDVDALAQEIRLADGSNTLGAAALAEALMPFLRKHATALIAALGEGQEDPVAWLCHGGKVFVDSAHISKAHAERSASNNPGSTVSPLYPSPAHTSEARDAARLDWLERRGCWRFSGPSETDIRGPAYRWFDYDTEGIDYSATLREAIDAAMRQEGDTP